MTTGLSYDGTVSGTTSYITQMATMAVVDETDAAFLAILPQMISYAENRIYRDVDLLWVSASNSNYFVSAGGRTLTFPMSTNMNPTDIFGGGNMLICEQLNLLTPAGNPNPDASIRNPLLPVTKEFLDAVYGASGQTGQPKYFAPFNDNLFYVGPFADQKYYVEIVATLRPVSMSATQKTTFISLYLPDLCIMASMVYISGYQRNFSGSSSNDPQMGVNYESQYNTLLKGAVGEEARKKLEAAGWSSQAPATVASPTRG